MIHALQKISNQMSADGWACSNLSLRATRSAVRCDLAHNLGREGFRVGEGAPRGPCGRTCETPPFAPEVDARLASQRIGQTVARSGTPESYLDPACEGTTARHGLGGRVTSPAAEGWML